MDNPKRCAVVFDFDGTLIHKHGSLCRTVDDAALSPEANQEMVRLREQYLDLAIRGQLTSEKEADWLMKTLDAYVNDGLTPERAHEALRGVILRPGARQCLEWLHREGVPVAVVSYGVTPFIEAVLRSNGSRGFVDRIYATELAVSSETGRFCAYDAASLVLPLNKGEWSRHFADANGVPHERLIAVGDSGGDKFLGHLKERRIGIAKDEAEAAKFGSHMGQVVITEDFAPVTEWLTRTIDLI